MSAALPPYPPASPRYKCLVERMFNQRDIENYFSELISILGYKPTKQGAEARTRQVDFNLIYRHDEDLGTRARTVREKKYSREALVARRTSARARQPLRKARPPHADAPRSLPPLVPDPRARARVLARMALQVELGPSLLPRHGRVARLHGGAARPRGARRPSTAEGCKQRLAPLRAAPARGTAAWGVGYADEPRPLWPFLLPQAHHADKAIRLQFRPGC